MQLERLNDGKMNEGILYWIMWEYFFMLFKNVIICVRNLSVYVEIERKIYLICKKLIVVELSDKILVI